MEFQADEATYLGLIYTFPRAPICYLPVSKKVQGDILVETSALLCQHHDNVSRPVHALCRDEQQKTRLDVLLC